MPGAIRLAIARCVLKLVSDAAKLQEVQVQILADEVRSRAEHFQHYGFTSVPLPGAEGVCLFVGGARSHPIVVNVDDRRHRLKDLESGEVALYTDEGDFVVFKRGRIIEMKAGAEVKVDAPLATFEHDVHIKGALHVDQAITCDDNVSDQAGSMQEIRDTYNDHNHGGSGPTPLMT